MPVLTVVGSGPVGTEKHKRDRGICAQRGEQRNKGRGKELLPSQAAQIDGLNALVEQLRPMHKDKASVHFVRPKSMHKARIQAMHKACIRALFGTLYILRNIAGCYLCT